MSTNKEQSRERRTTDTITACENHFPQEKVHSFSNKHQEDMSQQEMEQSSGEILELKDEGEILEEKDIKYNNLEVETMEKGEEPLPKIYTNDSRSSNLSKDEIISQAFDTSDRADSQWTI